jgi:hypothetical protein
MTRNVGSTDKIIRVILAALIAVLYLTNQISGTFAIVLLIFAVILVLTSFFSFCGIYTLLGINTCKLKK